jgi:hypothetical protein
LAVDGIFDAAAWPRGGAAPLICFVEGADGEGSALAVDFFGDAGIGAVLAIFVSLAFADASLGLEIFEAVDFDSAVFTSTFFGFFAALAAAGRAFRLAEAGMDLAGAAADFLVDIFSARVDFAEAFARTAVFFAAGFLSRFSGVINYVGATAVLNRSSH